MKMFDDLVFEERDDMLPGTRSTFFFDNGYGVSVITGPMFHTDVDHPYELAVLKGFVENSRLCYDTPVTDDVIGHLSESEISATMELVQKLPA